MLCLCARSSLVPSALRRPIPMPMQAAFVILAPERATHAPLVVSGSCNRALEAGTGRVAHEEKPVRLFKAAVTPLLPPNWGCYERGRQQRLLCVRGRERGVLLRLVTGLVTAWLPITRLWLRAGHHRVALPSLRHRHTIMTRVFSTLWCVQQVW
jgi:hypothetical protein